MDVSGPVRHFATAVSRERRVAASYTKGKATAGTATTTTIQAVVHPIDGRTLALLEEGIRETAKFVMFTVDDVRCVDKASSLPPDRISWESVWYRCWALEPWLQHGGFRRIVLLEDDQ